MKKPFLFLLFCISVVCKIQSQTIDDLMNEVSTANLQTNVFILSGEQSATINGSTQTIVSRVQSNNDLAAEFIKEQLEALPSLSVEFQDFNTQGKNIIATQLGQTNPDDIYLVCAHYDSVTTYCADDNATGVSAVIEIARILSSQCLDKTIVYALWDEEEIGLLGANYYAQQAADETNGNTRDNILGVLNMDMIGYDGDAPGTVGDNDFDIDVRNIANSIAIKDDLLNILNSYTFDLNPIVVNPGTTASDHSRFWNQNYSAVLVGESWETNDETPNYHTSNDRVVDIDFQYMTELTKLVLAYMTTKAQLVTVDNTISVTENSLMSNDTSVSYQWYNCDTNTPISGETNQNFLPISSGNYAVEVTNGSCTELSPCVAFSLLSFEEFSDEDIQIHPNPISSVLNIENNSHFELEISIFDINGKKIFKSHSGNSTIQIDIKNNASGIYFLKLKSEAKSSIYKFVKE